LRTGDAQFYIATILRGYLIVRSGYLPKPMGVLLMLGRASFVAKNVTMLLTPAYSSDLFLIAMFPAGLSLMLWMIVRGVDLAKWEARAAVLSNSRLP
jgi:hypothetical protein